MTKRANHNLTLLQTAISHIYLKAKVGAGGGDVTWQVTYKRFRYKIKYRKKDLHEWFSSPAICRLKEGMSASNNWPTSYPEQRTEFLSYTVPMRQWLLYFHSFLSCIHRCFQFVRHTNFISQNIWYILPSPGVTACRLLQYILPFSLRFPCTAWLIHQSLRFQAQVTLASLGWCYKPGECAKSCARRSVCCWSQSIGGASIRLFM